MLRNVLRSLSHRATLNVIRHYGKEMQRLSETRRDIALGNASAIVLGLRGPHLDQDKVQDKICPVGHPILYRAPASEKSYDNLIFGFPIAMPPHISDPEKTVNCPVKDPEICKKPKIEAHKRDKHWKRRGMKRHRYLRWRKRNQTMLAHREVAKQEKRSVRLKIKLESIWKDAGLEKEPPKLSESEKKTLTMKWKEEGIWTDAFTPEELYKLVSPSEPKNKKILPVKTYDHIPR